MLVQTSDRVDAAAAEPVEVVRSLDALELSLRRLRLDLARVDSDLRDIRQAYRVLAEAGRLAAEGHVPRQHRLKPLTAREGRVALLAAGGRSNLDIATELRVSVHTVKSQMRNVLRKLEVESRWQLRHLGPAGQVVLHRSGSESSDLLHRNPLTSD
jgi:DNA-binding NarL/FixJ family response regulator